MYAWNDDFVIQAILSFPNLRYFIWQASDYGDYDAIIDLLFALEFDSRMSA